LHTHTRARARTRIPPPRAQLFWPDDGLWYRVVIVSVVQDAQAPRASINYATGEEEELELRDIIDNGHMSLLPA
jgi:hypothetical protein